MIVNPAEVNNLLADNGLITFLEDILCEIFPRFPFVGNVGKGGFVLAGLIET